ncbi:MAG: GHKL domain-containing protein [Clostridia bacterium]|nr:GHKL domain-containing protein [Clostridia bacterium]
MNVSEMIERTLSMLITYLPPIIIALVPFRDTLRFSKAVTALLVSVLCACILFVSFNVYADLNNYILLPLSLVICAAFAVVAIKAHPGKIIFTIIILSNITNCVMVVSTWLERVLFGAEAAIKYMNYTNVISTLVVSVVIISPIYIYFNGIYREGISKNIKSAAWKFLWIIPASFYIMWVHHLEDSGVGLTELAFETGHAVFFLVLNAGAFFAYHTVIRMIDTQAQNLELEQINNQLTIQTLQHENLTERIAEARRAKHDVRHHITFLDICLQKGEYEKAAEYLKSYEKSLPDDSAIVFSKHDVINSLLLYYAQLSKNNGVDFDVIIMDIPKEINLPDSVFSVVFGNLLENALEACCEQSEGDRVIALKCKADKNSFFLHLENTYNGKTVRRSDGGFLTSKKHGSGLGIDSVRKVAENYDGILETGEANGRFSVSLFLNLPQE